MLLILSAAPGTAHYLLVLFGVGLPGALVIWLWIVAFRAMKSPPPQL